MPHCWYRHAAIAMLVYSGVYLCSSIQVLKSKYFHTSLRSFKCPQQRLERIISGRGVGSRKVVSELLKRGKVLVNGKRVLSGAGQYPTNVSISVEGVIWPEVKIGTDESNSLLYFSCLIVL